MLVTVLSTTGAIRTSLGLVSKFGQVGLSSVFRMLCAEKTHPSNRLQNTPDSVAGQVVLPVTAFGSPYLLRKNTVKPGAISEVASVAA